MTITFLLLARALLLSALLCCCLPLRADPLRALDDEELEQVTGRDGISIATHLVINDPTLPGAVNDSRIAVGFHGEGDARYLVIRNLRGVVDMFALGLDVRKRPDGGQYVAVSLPGKVKYTNFGYESLSVQNDPLAPVTNSLGSLNINGSMSMHGELRIWAH
ncbi:hypothetical protein MJ904_13200 [Massilia sp. MB5]|uniref:hypothetical protein n=1 Tax=unclassified Massilia TaxID=2609279 RepID=UPI000AAE67FB|nr:MULTISPECIES: hypothetical protein [unclassified Massilia]UMR33033.1 hypothetical protein MJ904_13200 [Massilia sp. MB5]